MAQEFCLGKTPGRAGATGKDFPRDKGLSGAPLALRCKGSMPRGWAGEKAESVLGWVQKFGGRVKI
jgi:hypothetical protein